MRLAVLLPVGLVAAGVAIGSMLTVGSGHPLAGGPTALSVGTATAGPRSTKMEMAASPMPAELPSAAAGAATPTPSAGASTVTAAAAAASSASNRAVSASSASAGAAAARPANSSAGGGVLTGGDSKTHCIALNFAGGVLNQSQINAASTLTGVTFNCLSVFDAEMPAWTDWEDPWMFRITGDGWDAWLKADVKHEAVMSQDLIPASLGDTSNPLSWEQACAAGDYNQYATALAQNLVSEGAGRIGIRLGQEANGSWEDDFVGTTSTEMTDWAKCFDNEVSAMRAVPGSDFLFVWNPNVCTNDIPNDAWYPGNAYVDIIGMDAYDVDCGTLKTVQQEGWTAYYTDSSSASASDTNFPSMSNIVAFAKSNGKPLAFPEWGIDTGMGDDTSYITHMAQMFDSDDFAFESYFDLNDDGVSSLGSSIPNATAAYNQSFG